MNFDFNKTGEFTLSLIAEDWAGNQSTIYKKFKVFPGQLSTNTTINVSTQQDKFANNSNYYTYTLSLKDSFDNPIYGKNIVLVDQYCTGYNGCKTILENMSTSTPTGSDVLDEYDYSGVSSSAGLVTFKLKSLSPGIFTQRFKLRINKWDVNYDNIDNQYNDVIITLSDNNSFKKPFIVSSLKVTNDNGADGYTAIPEVGTSQEYVFTLSNPGSLTSYSNGSINITKNIIENKITGHSWENFTDITNNFGSNIGNYLGFFGRIDAKSNTLIAPKVQFDKLVVNYMFESKNISYIINNSEDAAGNTAFGPTVGSDKDTLGLKVIGTLQGKGKIDQTGQKVNLSDISQSDLRTKIRKDAYAYIKSMANGKIVGNVKYILGDTTLTGEISGYETLVVLNGNIKITGDLNTNNKKLGIIVLKDKYNVSKDYVGIGNGNVYISKDVKLINAIIYADGGLISSDASGNPYLNDNKTRTEALQKQLVMNGTLFTRNTIGGSLLGTQNKYTLPGGSETPNFDKAMVYDLNYIRRSNKGCDKNTDGDCIDTNLGEYKDSFIIKYDSKAQTNPPKLFK